MTSRSQAPFTPLCRIPLMPRARGDGRGLPGRAAILSGERGAGKTTLCLLLAEKLLGAGGIVCPAVFDRQGKKTGFRCLCLQSRVSWRLGTVSSAAASAGLHTGKFTLSPTGVDKAITCIHASLLARNGITVIDEIGPLELEQGSGFAAVLPLLEAAGDLLLVVRSRLVEEVLSYVRTHRTRVFHVTEANRAALADEVAGFFDEQNE